MKVKAQLEELESWYREQEQERRSLGPRLPAFGFLIHAAQHLSKDRGFPLRVRLSACRLLWRLAGRIPMNAEVYHE
jgi:hypothetical protein